MATISDGFSARPFDLVLNVNETSTNSAANTSVVTWTLQLDPTGTTTSYSLISADNTYSISIDGGSAITGNYTFDFRTSTTSTRTIASGTKTITHNSDGSKTIAIDAESSSVVLGSANCTPGSLTLTDFVLVPNAPSSAPTLSRSSDGATVTVTSATATSVPTITDYEYAYSTDGSNWLPSSTTGVSMGTDRVATFAATSTQTYFFRTRAKSSDGAGSWSTSSTIHGVPTSPATIVATRTGRDVTVVAGASSGTGITGYSVQYSTNAGSSWSTAQAMTSQSYTYTSLTSGLDYLFRVYASNSIGDSAFTTSASLFVPAGGKRYDGTTFNSTSTAKRFDGTQWVDLTVAKRWNGSSWVDMS